MFVRISDVSDNEDDSEDEENNKNSRNSRNNAAGIKGQKNIKDCFVSLDTLKMEKGGDAKSKTKTEKVSNYKLFFHFFCSALTFLLRIFKIVKPAVLLLMMYSNTFFKILPCLYFRWRLRLLQLVFLGQSPLLALSRVRSFMMKCWTADLLTKPVITSWIKVPFAKLSTFMRRMASPGLT